MAKQLVLQRDGIARLGLPTLQIGGIEMERIHAKIIGKRRGGLDIIQDSERKPAPNQNRVATALL